MHSTTRPTAPATRPATGASDADCRIVYNAVRTLVPEADTVALDDLVPVTRLEPDAVAAAMDRLGRAGALSIHRLEAADPAWLVRRTDR